MAFFKKFKNFFKINRKRDKDQKPIETSKPSILQPVKQNKNLKKTASFNITQNTLQFNRNQVPLQNSSQFKANREEVDLAISRLKLENPELIEARKRNNQIKQKMESLIKQNEKIIANNEQKIASYIKSGERDMASLLMQRTALYKKNNMELQKKIGIVTKVDSKLREAIETKVKMNVLEQRALNGKDLKQTASDLRTTKDKFWQINSSMNSLYKQNEGKLNESLKSMSSIKNRNSNSTSKNIIPNQNNQKNNFKSL